MSAPDRSSSDPTNLTESWVDLEEERESSGFQSSQPEGLYSDLSDSSEIEDLLADAHRDSNAEPEPEEKTRCPDVESLLPGPSPGPCSSQSQVEAEKEKEKVELFVPFSESRHSSPPSPTVSEFLISDQTSTSDTKAADDSLSLWNRLQQFAYSPSGFWMFVVISVSSSAFLFWKWRPRSILV